MYRGLPLTTHSIAYSTNAWLSNILGIQSKHLKWNTSRCTSVNIPSKVSEEHRSLLADISFHEYHMGKLKTLFDFPCITDSRTSAATEHLRSVACFMRPENTLYDVLEYTREVKPWLDLSEYDECITQWFERSSPMRVPEINNTPCSDIIYMFRNENINFDPELYRRLVWYQASIDSTLDDLDELVQIMEVNDINVTSVYRNFVSVETKDSIKSTKFFKDWSIFNDFIEFSDYGCTVIFNGSIYEIQYSKSYKNKQKKLNGRKSC